MAEEVTMTWRKPLHDVAVQKIIDDCDAGKWDQSPIFRLPFEDLGWGPTCPDTDC
jgi:hypothetical protein